MFDKKQYSQEYYKKNRDRLLKQKAEYYKANKEEKKNYDKNYYLKNKNEILSNKVEYYIKNKEIIIENRKEYYSNNRENIINYKQIFYSENKEKIRKDHIITTLFRSARHRATIYNRLFDLDKADIIIPDICPYLNIPIIIDINEESYINSPSIDRIINEGGYTKNNIIIVSRKANLIKNNLSIEEIKLMFQNYDKSYIGVNKCHNREKLLNIVRCARFRAKRNNMSCNITIDDIIIPDICPILNIPIAFGNKQVEPGSPSLDRIDNTKGYIKENIRIVSHRANTCKNIATKKDFELLLSNLNKIMRDRNLL